MRRVNPSVKAIAILAAAVIIAFGYSVPVNLAVIAYCLVLMLLSRANLKALLLVLIPVSVAAVSLFFAIYIGRGGSSGLPGEGLTFTAAVLRASSFHDALAVALRIYAFSFMGMLFALTTDVTDFIYSLMQQLHLRPNFAYGILAALNLLPMMRRELEQIRLAYLVRGFRITPVSVRPAFTALVNAVHWSESLAMAMESKGFDDAGGRTFSRTLRVRPLDILWAASLIALAVLGLVLH